EVLGVYSLLAQVGPDLAVGEQGLVTVDARKGNVYAQPCTRRAGEAGAVVSTVVALGAPHKVPLDALQVHYPGWRHLTGRPPDAAVLAATGDTGPAEPLYL